MSEKSNPKPEVVTYEQVERRLKVEDEFRYNCWRWQLPQLLVSAFAESYRFVNLKHNREHPATSFESSQTGWSAAHAGIISITRSYVI